MPNKLGRLNLFMRDYGTSIQKDSITNKHGLAVYVNESLYFAYNLSQRKSEDYLFSLHSEQYLFFQHPSVPSSLPFCAQFLMLFHVA